MLNKKYDFKYSEHKWQKYWQDNLIYKFDSNNNNKVYSIDTPPPTVSGSIHIGHIFSYTQSEIIARYQRMMGKNVFYPFGFDDNGLPTERLVEKEEGLIAKDLPRQEFIHKCGNTTKKYINEFKNLFKSMGFSVDWNLQYDTINPLAQRVSQRSFIELAKSGKAYQKDTPVLWCTNCQTSIAQAELDVTEKETTFNYIPFNVDGEELLVATTRPELLFGCVCMFVNPDDNRYRKFIGKNAEVPLYNFTIPIYSDNKVAVDKGTGVVMCATFGDSTDLEWYTSYKLEYKKVIQENGLIYKGVPYIGGLTVINARAKIIELLKEKGLLRKSEVISHTVAVHERCGKEIEIIPSKQWYIDILSDKGKFLKAGNEINWYPASMKSIYDSWVSNIKWDWCISRQRYFGIPFPVWYCKNCGRVIYAEESELPVNPLETSPKHKCSCGCSEFIPEKAVMDTWATSSTSPLINAKWNERDYRGKDFIPMSIRTQAHEIIRTWTFYTIVKSLYHTGKIPWENIMLSGFVLAKKGEKLSKSKSNGVLSPELLIENHSADALRYWTTNAKLGTDTMFSEEDLKLSKRFLTKLWNSARFVIMHLENYYTKNLNNIQLNQLEPIDRWIIEKSQKVMNSSIEFLNQYEIGMARHEIDDFFWNDFCDNYIEIAKDRLYKPEIFGYESTFSAQYGLYKSFLNILKLYAIFVPHITEEIYQSYYKNSEECISIHLLNWQKSIFCDSSIIEFGEAVKYILDEVRKYKSAKNMSLKSPLQSIKIGISAEYLKYLEYTRKDLIACTTCSKIEFFKADKISVEITDAV